jgi:hypothetical protein
MNDIVCVSHKYLWTSRETLSVIRLEVEYLYILTASRETLLVLRQPSCTWYSMYSTGTSP